MKIKVKYTAQLKKAIGTGEELLEVQGGLVIAQLLDILFEKNREAFTAIVFNERGEFMNATLLVLNGKQIAYTSKEVLDNNDIVTLMSPIAGG